MRTSRMSGTIALNYRWVFGFWYFFMTFLLTCRLLIKSSLGELLRLRVRLADRLFAIHKLHANYGRVFSEWSALERTMGDSLQVYFAISQDFCNILSWYETKGEGGDVNNSTSSTYPGIRDGTTNSFCEGCIFPGDSK